MLRRATDANTASNRRYLNYFWYEGNNKTGVNAAAGADMSTQDGVTLTGVRLLLNGQSRHPIKLDQEYLQRRLLPLHHSQGYGNESGLNNHLSNIYTLPLSLNPEGQNPSGAVNFSKVTHAQLELTVTTSGAAVDKEYELDIYGTYYNWLAIKDGRAILSFS